MVEIEMHSVAKGFELFLFEPVGSFVQASGKQKALNFTKEHIFDRLRLCDSSRLLDKGKSGALNNGRTPRSDGLDDFAKIRFG